MLQDSLITGRDDGQQPFLPMTNKQQETNTAAEISAIDKVHITNMTCLTCDSQLGIPERNFLKDESVVDKSGREEKRRKRTRSV